MSNKSNKPKIEGLSFNLFAIVALIVLLPILTAFITQLSSANKEDYSSIIEPNNVQMSNEPTTQLVYWVDKGDNMTDLYQETYQIADVGNQLYNAYASIWDVNNNLYRYNSESNFLGYNNDDNSALIDGRKFKLGVDNHRYLGGTYFQTPTAATNWQGYIGYSGDSFEMEYTRNLTKFIDPNQDVSGIKFTFIDPFTAYNCDAPIFEEISFKSDITIRDQFNTRTYSNFEFEQIPSYKNNFAFASGQYQERCHISMTIDLDFTPFEDIEISEVFSNFSNTTWNLKIYDISSTNYFDTNYSNPFLTLIPFAGDGFYGYDVEIAYVDTATTNFWLKGGTLILGIGLFGLAIASTPYWNPVTNFFKPKGGV